jgi:hypothetical protein
MELQKIWKVKQSEHEMVSKLDDIISCSEIRCGGISCEECPIKEIRDAIESFLKIPVIE